MNLLQPNETALRGQWCIVDGVVVADETARRIDELVSRQLIKIAVSKDGWDALYLDKLDGRLWELSYPDSYMHGGGPPSLVHVTKNYADEKYVSAT